jgi:diketogulonate reductase-like aldo/keto reductase
MEQRRFGLSNFEVSAIGQGTWNMERDDRAAAIASLRLGIQLGMTHIDTAEMYGSGEVEQLVGEAIGGLRQRVFLVSKVLPENASRSGTIAACERSLSRLKTDYLDCYLLHWPGSHPLADTVAAFERLEQAGKIRSWGVSNFDVADLEELRALASPNRPVQNQVLYHLRQRAIEHAVLPWCRQHGASVTAYSPFGHNRFPGPDTQAGKVLHEIATRHEASPRQVALRFLLRQPEVLVIPKASDPEHVRENAAADALGLDEDDVAAIERAFPLGRRPRELPVI